MPAKSVLFTVLASAALLTPAAPAAAAPAPPRQQQVNLVAALSGKQEVPRNSGDPDATGVALLTLHRNGRLCYVLHVRDVDGDITQAHIHRGLSGHDGPVATALSEPMWHGSAAACTNLGRRQTERLWNAPQRYYVNVHSSKYPDGALRGQLRLT
ncbi:CHRD domain-containing protein [Dactylosporangium sp. NPDC000244]|uniref:CHRD domain-containing protein n=1 Tax=Dactylosporangium sp. NPDC000244 TaxID=3154365 RepID=UPI00331B851C